MAKLLFILNFFVLLVNGEEGVICTTPNAKKGHCMELTECPELLTMAMNENRTKDDLNLLKNSYCWRNGDKIYVCCPVPRCRTPENIEGDCIYILSCPHISAKITRPVTKENIAYIKNSICLGPHPYSVCCSPPPETKFTEVAEKSPICSDKIFPQHPSSGCCGREGAAPSRIIGGVDAAIDQFPWMALIEYDRRNKNANPLLCGAALISSRYVLTAAHCINKQAIQAVGIPKFVRLGEYDTANDGQDCVIVEGGGMDCTDGAVKISIQTYTPHPEYDITPGINDIGLLRLVKNAPYTDFIRPICLPTSDITLNATTLPNLKFYVSGWGRTDKQTSFSNIKQYAQISFYDKQVCQTKYTTMGRMLPEAVVCAGSQSGQDTCKGDSGGPLMHEMDAVYELTGVVSFGPWPCGQRDIPGVYTKVYSYQDWILSNIVE